MSYLSQNLTLLGMRHISHPFPPNVQKSVGSPLVPSVFKAVRRTRTTSIHPSDTPTSSTTTLTIQNRMQPERASGRARAPVLCVILLLCRTISKENGDQETNQRPRERGEEGDHLTFLNAFT